MALWQHLNRATGCTATYFVVGLHCGVTRVLKYQKGSINIHKYQPHDHSKSLTFMHTYIFLLGQPFCK